MISIALILGAPVIEPPGKAARRIAPGVAPGRGVARTVEVRWCTDGKRSGAIISSTETLPISAMRPRSLRSRSTIMMCSARSLGLAASSAASASSRSGAAPRGRVPLMGRVSMTFPLRRRKRSGEALTTANGPQSR